MIYEFALEPELVATWHDRRNFLFFEEKFGLRTRRIVSAYPKKWVSQVWKAFRNSPEGNNQNAERNLDALLRDLTQNMVKRPNTFSDISVWIIRAEKEHAERPFHAIIANNNPNTRNFIIPKDDLIESGCHTCWSPPDTPIIRRNADELATAVAPLLRASRHVIFIDPYFDPNKRQFVQPFSKFFIETWDYNHSCEGVLVELHTGIDRQFYSDQRGSQRDPERERRAVEYLISQFEEKLPRIIPAGRKIKVFIWKQRENGERLHNRYLLTEVAGVMFGTGLDQAQAAESLETDDLVLLTSTQLDQRWKHFKSDPGAFISVTDPFEVTGRSSR